MCIFSKSTSVAVLILYLSTSFLSPAINNDPSIPIFLRILSEASWVVNLSLVASISSLVTLCPISASSFCNTPASVCRAFFASIPHFAILSLDEICFINLFVCSSISLFAVTFCISATCLLNSRSSMAIISTELCFRACQSKFIFRAVCDA